MDLIRKNPRVGFSAYADVRIIREKATTTFRSVWRDRDGDYRRGQGGKTHRARCHHRALQILVPAPRPRFHDQPVAIIRIDIDSLMGKYAPAKRKRLKA